MSGTLTIDPREFGAQSASNALVAAQSAPGRATPPKPAAETALVGSHEREVAFRKCVESLRGFLELAPDWDSYGGTAAAPTPVRFARQLLDELHLIPSIPAPLVQPIDGGVYVEWRSGDSLLYFEADEESVLTYLHSVYGIETEEDSAFDVSKAKQAVVRFIQEAA